MVSTYGSSFARISRSLVIAGMLGANACATEVDAGDITTTSAQFTIDECGRWQEAPNDADNVRPDIYYNEPGVEGPPLWPLPIITPTTYSNPKCWRGYVIAAQLLVSDTTLDTGGGPTARATVSWNDAIPTNRADCNSTYMMGIVYDFTLRTPKHGFTAIGMQQSSGVWAGWPINRCVIRPMVFDSANYLQHLEPGRAGGNPPSSDYSFAITGRAPNGATRSLRFDYSPPEIIH